MFYLLDKPKGISSFKAIRNFAKENNIKKVGHTGTLDPLATGMLLIATDEDTKLIDYVDKGQKTYLAEMELGKISNTYDIEGKITKTNSLIPTNEKIIKELEKFIGDYLQTPPIYSAKKISGQKAYDLARAGKEIEMKANLVNIINIEKIEFLNNNKVSFEVTVSRGTYIRSIIHDLGQRLNCGAIMTNLRRTKIGNLKETNLNKVVSIIDLFIYPILNVPIKIENLINGQKINTNEVDGNYGLFYKKDIIGIVSVENNIMKTKRIFGNKIKEIKWE